MTSEAIIDMLTRAKQAKEKRVRMTTNMTKRQAAQLRALVDHRYKRDERW